MKKQKVVLEGVTRVPLLKGRDKGGDRFYTKTYKRSIPRSLSPPLLLVTNYLILNKQSDGTPYK